MIHALASECRIKLLYDVSGWAYHNRCLALQKHAPPGWDIAIENGNAPVFSPEPADLYLQLCYSHADRLRAHVGQGPLIVTGCNTGWMNELQRGGQEFFPTMRAASDWIVFNSRAAWGLAGRPERTSQISNGVDLDTYRATIPMALRTPRVLWLGSIYHSRPELDTKNFCSILKPLAERLKAHGIAFDFRQVDSDGLFAGRGSAHQSPAELAEWYNTGTVYVVASGSEGTPNPALEAAACGCTVVSAICGNMPELIEHGSNGLLVDRTLEAVEAGVLQAIKRYDQWGPAMQESIAKWGWRERAARYFDLFRRLIEEKHG